MKHSIKKFQNVNHSLDFNDDNSVYFNDASALFLKIFGKNIHTYRKFHFFNIVERRHTNETMVNENLTSLQSFSELQFPNQIYYHIYHM